MPKKFPQYLDTILFIMYIDATDKPVYDDGI